MKKKEKLVKKYLPVEPFDMAGLEQWLSHKEHFPAIVGVISTLCCLLICGKDIFLIPSMVLMALLLTLRPKAKRRTTT